MTSQDHRWRGQGRGFRLARTAVGIRADVSLAILDVVLVVAAYLIVLVLRFDGSVPVEWWAAYRSFIPVAVFIHILANWTCGLYGKIWRHAGIEEARRLLLAASMTGIILGGAYLTVSVTGLRRMPASVVVFGVILAIGFIGALRFQARLFAFRRAGARAEGHPVLVIGAGEAAATIVRDMDRNPTSGWHPVAIVDDDVRKHRRQLGRVPIVGTIDEIPEIARRYPVSEALLAIPSADAELVRRTAALVDEAGLTLKVLPSIKELVGGRASLRDVRDLSINDLLGRQQVHTDLVAVNQLLCGRRVLITGAGGSIGSELARQVALCDPIELVLLDHDETHLHDAALELPREAEQILIDIRDRRDVQRVFQAYRPEVVFHAAAHKHVPILERHAVAAARTNVIGTANVVEAARDVGARHLVFISTDKAVRPVSVMGASKRAGEFVALHSPPPEANWCAVRFGNVLGSRGSVIPTFMRQLAVGGPLTVTDDRMTRFFMSIEEAVQLVLQAAALSNGGEIFMLDMGQPVRIRDLAERIVRISGGVVGRDVHIHVTGIRPGEKLVEQLQEPEEAATPTSHPSITALTPVPIDSFELETFMAHLTKLSGSADEAGMAELLRSGLHDRQVRADR